MKCFELKNDTLKEGLPITDVAGLPRVNVTRDGSTFLAFDERLQQTRAKAPKIAGYELRLLDASLTKTLRTLTPPKFKHGVLVNDKLALLLLTLDGGKDGDVTLSACAFEEAILDADRVDKLYRPFPPQGIEILGTFEEPPPWCGGSTALDLALIMIAGASIRIARTGHLTNARRTTYLSWTGYELIDRPYRKGATQQGANQEEQQHFAAVIAKMPIEEPARPTEVAQLSAVAH